MPAQAEVVELEHNYRTAEAELRRMRERFKRQPRNRAVREKETGARLARKAMDEGKRTPPRPHLLSQKFR